MIFNRPYMREREAASPGGQKALNGLILSLVLVFLAQCVGYYWLKTSAPHELLAASQDGLLRGRIWQVFTYGWLHSVEQVLHLLLNALFIYLMGRRMVEELGTRRFFGLYLGGVACGSLAWFLLNLHHSSPPLVGASAAVMALFTAYCLMHRDEVILLFFIIPLRPMVALWVTLGISLFFLAFLELPAAQGSNTAHSAHLGGALAGWVFHELFVQRRRWFAWRPSVELPRWFRRRKGPVAEAAQHYSVNIGSGPQAPDSAKLGPAELRAEVDRILDKINSRGFGSLSPAEKRLLDEARDLLNRR